MIEPANSASSPVEKSNKFPSGIPYIIGNEAAERFSYYGMRAILFMHLSMLFLGFPTGKPVDEIKDGPPRVVAEKKNSPEADGKKDQPDAAAEGKPLTVEEIKKLQPKHLVEAADAEATKITHIFMALVYAFPMLGAIAADRLFGKYRVIMWLSLVYCAGHAALSISPYTLNGMWIGLVLIAIGSGGIKPCVSANVGDQFTEKNSHLIPTIYQIFYFSINFGSFFATIIIPFLYALPTKHYADIAFGVPGILMAVATVIFWMGRNKFTRVPPKPGGKLGLLDTLSSFLLFAPFMFLIVQIARFKIAKPKEVDLTAAYTDYFGPMAFYFLIIAVPCFIAWYFVFSYRQKQATDSGFFSIFLYAFQNRHRRQSGQGFFEVAREKFGEDCEGPAAVLRIMVVFSMVSVFWSLFDQHSSTWVKQAELMNRTVQMPWMQGPTTLGASQAPFMNPMLVMLTIPFLNYCVYRPLRKRGIEIKPLVRMTVGMFLTAGSFVAASILQSLIESSPPNSVHVGWQIFPYLILTVAEVLVSVTGLEFAYTQAPRAMKSTIMGFWLICVAIGNLVVAVLAPLQQIYKLSTFFWTFSTLMCIAAVVFTALAYTYKGKTYLQKSEGH